MLAMKQRLVMGAGAAALVFLGTVGMTTAAGASSVVSGVTFSGSTSSPTITVSGSGFGTEPAATPDADGCYPNLSNQGDTFGTKFYFIQDNLPWEAGYAKKGHQSCIGINVSSWSSTNIVFSFGAAYGLDNGQFVLANGNNFGLNVKGFVWGGLVSGLS
jgi:hypothetical protein